MTLPPPSRIYVIAGVNGAGKSSVAGATVRSRGADYYNPDEATRKYLAADPTLTEAEANSKAWHEGVRLLQTAIEKRLEFAFETTLGGNTIRDLLIEAASLGIELHIWYAGLSSPELHIARVKARVAHGGHDIPEAKIRQRYLNSQKNLVALLPFATAVRVFDNSLEAAPEEGKAPTPELVLHLERGKVLYPQHSFDCPLWASPIVEAALEIAGQTAPDFEDER